MARLFTLLLLTVLLSCSKIVEDDSVAPKTLHTTSQDIIILYKGQEYPYTIKRENICFPYNGDTNKVVFATKIDSIEMMLAPGENIAIDFVVNQSDTFSAVAVGRPKPAAFSDAYIEENKGTYQVFCPEVHELVNIAVALTDIGQQDDNMVYKKTPYYEKVMQQFSQYADHPLIDSLNRHITEVFGEETYHFYYNIRMNACVYSFDSNHKIAIQGPYQRLGFSDGNYLEELLPLLEDFADTSKFDSFYQTNSGYYDSLIASYKELVPVQKMWDWLEQRFPQKYDAYKVYFSPLIGGAHSTQKLADNGYQETIMFISAPWVNKDEPLKESEASLSRVVFTEIDHNYVNPTTDQYPIIDSLLTPLDCWNSGVQGYQNSYQTFNAYMTWAVFTLYLYDTSDSNVFSKINEQESSFMASEWRGFHKFKEFNDFALDWYKKHPQKSLEEMYPEAIAWIKEQSCND